MGELAGLDSSGASRGRAVACAVCFRPCIDIHKGKVKQIVGSTLRDASDDGTALVTNFESDKSPAEFANIYKEDGLVGGHVIMLGGDPASRYAALEALLLFLPYSSASSFSYQTTSLLLQCLAGGARGGCSTAREQPLSCIAEEP